MPQWGDRPQSIIEGGTFGGILLTLFIISLLSNDIQIDRNPPLATTPSEGFRQNPRSEDKPQINLWFTFFSVQCRPAQAGDFWVYVWVYGKSKREDDCGRNPG